jgi:SAM-dependent methyltransferase
MPANGRPNTSSRDATAAMFDVAAASYDAFMGRWSRLLAPRLADFAGVHAGQRVIDVGCGTGMLTAELVARVGAANVVAADPSEAFLAAVRQRFPRVEVHRAAAEHLPVPDAVFDSALAQLVVHFMSDPGAGLLEMARVTRPGGAVTACVWDYGGGRDALADFWAAARTLLPNAHDESGLAGVREGQLAQLMTVAGLRDVREEALTVELTIPTFGDWWGPFEHGVGPAGAFLASLGPDDREALRAACLARLGDGPLALSGTAWAARGMRGS